MEPEVETGVARFNAALVFDTVALRARCNPLRETTHNVFRLSFDFVRLRSFFYTSRLTRKERLRAPSTG